jgi:hypothetical protein
VGGSSTGLEKLPSTHAIDFRQSHQPDWQEVLSIGYTSDFVLLLGKKARLSSSNTRHMLVMSSGPDKNNPPGAWQEVEGQALKFTDENC